VFKFLLLLHIKLMLFSQTYDVVHW